ncbi:MAG: hypothetical protein L0Y72_02745 [Gemmataceae bacterium]|nr:hypothetical protein [Gemmataceae bacterium]MCI0737935.1 hypothetical protein [Gemmataceae bacterium]
MPVVELSLPRDLRKLRFPRALNRRLQELLDKQSEAGKLSSFEREEAKGLVEMAETMTWLRLKAERESIRKRSSQ